jgi:hypothetical protein
VRTAAAESFLILEDAVSIERNRPVRTIAFALLAAAALLLGACATSGGDVPGKQSMAGPGGTMPVKYAGYLMDSACGVPGKGMDGADVVHSPQDHTQACLVDCAASGYGISVKDGMVYRYIPFDKAGSDLANRTILQKTSRTRGVSIEVEGTLSGGVLTVRSIRETTGVM